MSYIALRNHTPYSLLEGAIPMATLIDWAYQQGMPALGVADRGHLFGALEFSLACQKKGIHPIIGCTLPVLFPSERAPFPMAIYASNKKGYINLCRLVSASTVNQPHDLRGSVLSQQLFDHHDGLLVLTGGQQGPLDQLLERKRTEEAYDRLLLLKNIFKHRLYMEIMRLEAEPDADGIDSNVTPERWFAEQTLIQWAYSEKLPLIATNPGLFVNPEDYEAHDALRCIALGRYVQEEDRERVSPYCFLRTPKMMGRLFSDIPEAIATTELFMKRCGFLLKAQPPCLPSFPCKNGQSEEDTLREESRAGLDARWEKGVVSASPNIPVNQALYDGYVSRLNYECDMIVRMGFSGYFLIVSDFIKWAKQHGIPVGPGRGSGASSLVAWALSITDVDPIQFQLFFERFLNPERVSMPDFDVDFCQERRDEVIAYVCQRYGADKVAHIITFGTLQARVVLRDVGRVLQMPYMQVDKICKLIPQNPANPVSLKDALILEPQLNEMAGQDDTVQRLLAIALKLEGLYRHASTHAAGVIISRGPLQDVVPLYQDEGSNLPATEFSMKYVESAGLIKFDFLGLKTLTVLQTAVNLVQKNQGIAVDIGHIPLNDSITFSLLCRAETVGLFQLESGGMTDVLRQLQPEEFKEIIALVALYRPGPMDDIPRYIACRHGREPITYPYPCMEEILKETFGVMVYQEQVLQIARVLAGYTMGGADLLRRAMGKKIKSEMDAQRKAFIDGAIAQYPGSQDEASTLFDQITRFAGYAFPKAHATPYALISYQTAYMKANYPIEFMTALMIHDMHNTDKLRGFVREVKRMGLKVALPDINISSGLFSVEGGNTIRYGLAALKGVGSGVMEKIVEERHAHGLFKDVFDFAQRTLQGGVNKKNLESLIAAGAFDALHPGKRSALMASVDVLLKATPPSLQGTLFQMDVFRPTLRQAPPWSEYEALSYERTAIGFYLSGHPLDTYLDKGFSLYERVEAQSTEKEQTFTMMGMVMDVVEKLSKSGKKYAFLHLSDPTGSYEVTLFSDLLLQSRSLLVVGQAIALTVSARITNEMLRLSAQRIRSMDEMAGSESITLMIDNQDEVELLARILYTDPHLYTGGLGRLSIVLSLNLDETTRVQAHISLAGYYKITPQFMSALSSFRKKN